MGNRQMRGVVSLAKKYHSDLIEKVATQAVNRLKEASNRLVKIKN